MKYLGQFVSKIPDVPGVYWFEDSAKKIIYIGKAKSLKKRVKSYFAKNLDSKKTELLVSQIRGIKYKKLNNELEALVWESKLIKKHQPHFNIDLKDDKTFPYIRLTEKDKWPRIEIVRRVKQDGEKYFGPFRAATAKRIIRLIKWIYPIRWCRLSPLKKRQQACLNHYVNRCPAPCVGKIKSMNYRGTIKSIARFLKGDIGAAKKILYRQMAGAAERQEYEAAANMRNSLFDLDRFAKESRNMSEFQQMDRRGDLEDLKETLLLRCLPRRIEAYDVSNTNASLRAGSLVVFEEGLPEKRGYRRFKIKNKQKNDDTAAVYEILTRRFGGKLGKTEKDPELILIDGGKPQVNAAKKALDDTNKLIKVISLAKKNEEICFPGQRKVLRLPRRSPALKLLQQIRDEAHRFAKKYHCARRTKKLLRP
jgi:excinuclease ABC subunit C